MNKLMDALYHPDTPLRGFSWRETFLNIPKEKEKTTEELNKEIDELTKNIERLKKENRELKIVLDSYNKENKK